MGLFEDLSAEIEAERENFSICGFISQSGQIYPLGTDTKVLSTVFELVIRPSIVKIANIYGYDVKEPIAQNHYPDFTLVPRTGEKKYIAIDVKTTYRSSINGKFSFTLGGYTSFIREASPNKNIAFPYTDYESHWVIGFVYTRVAEKKAADAQTFYYDEIKNVVLPFKDVDFFVQEKWRIAGTSAGSGNTTNIGSISGKIEDFLAGGGSFKDEAEYLAYWRAYGRTKSERKYTNLTEFRKTQKY
jgi:hypothetical protein